RFGPAGSATAAVIANAIAVWGTASGIGPFGNAGPEHGLVLLQIFTAVAATTSLFLGAIAEQNKHAQQRAELSERRLLMAMSGARIEAWEWDAGSADEKFYRELVHPDDLARVDAAIASRDSFEVDFRRLGEDGTLHWIAARGVAIEDQRLIGVDIDVTRLKQLEEELRLQDRRKDEFLAMLAHELRNPLAPILHATDLLGSSDAGVARDVIRRQSKHLARLVDDLLDVSRIARGQMRLERRRVLLVEDHADARRVLALMLTRSGHDVRTAGDGPAALAEAKRFAPEVVLLDIGLPGMDGYAVARQLRTLPECGGARLIALTGYRQAEDLEQSRLAGIDEHLLKPVEPAHLLALLERSISGAAAARG